MTAKCQTTKHQSCQREKLRWSQYSGSLHDLGRGSGSLQPCKLMTLLDSPGGPAVKSLPPSAGDPGWIPGFGKSPGEGNGNPLQYSCLENPVDRGAWRAAVHGVAKSQTWLSVHVHENNRNQNIQGLKRRRGKTQSVQMKARKEKNRCGK